MLICGKNNRVFNVQIESLKEDIFQVIIESATGEVMGEISFKIKADRAWIYSIGTAEKFQNMGVGQTLLNCFEYCCAMKRCQTVEGKYYPSNEFARQFYEKNSYEIYKDGYDCLIYKKLNIKEILENFKSKIVEGEILICG